MQFPLIFIHLEDTFIQSALKIRIKQAEVINLIQAHRI